MVNIGIIGTGYVGLVTGACFADLGNRVICIDNNRAKIELLKKGKIPIYEPGLEEIVKRNMKNSRLSFSTSIKTGVEKSEVIFICVGTPPRENGEPDLTALEYVSREIARYLNSYKLIVEKSTVPVETGEWVKRVINSFKNKKAKFDIASNPEFLREGSAVEDFMHPDRVVIGVESEKAKRTLKDLYSPLNVPILITDIKSAEIIKHASNSFLALKISYINAISRICELAGADISEVAKGIGMDKRIGGSFLKAGLGFGGSCLPKDLSAFIYIARKLGYDFDLLKEVQKINQEQIGSVLEKISRAIWNIPGKVICILGVSFKPNTDDIRNSPSIEIIKTIIHNRAKIRLYDPKALKNVKEFLYSDKDIKKLARQISFCKSPYEAAKGSYCLVVATEWNEFKELDFRRIKRLLKQPVIVDGRNIYDPEKMKKLGFIYFGVGR